jgi:hypothetical protein
MYTNIRTPVLYKNKKKFVSTRILKYFADVILKHINRYGPHNNANGRVGEKVCVKRMRVSLYVCYTILQ